MNILDIVKQIQRDLGNQFPLIGTNFIVDRLIDNYRDLYNKNNWDFYLKSIPFRIYKYYQQYAIGEGGKDDNEVVVEDMPDNYLEYDHLYTTYDKTPYEILSWAPYGDYYKITINQIFMNSITLKADGGRQMYIYKQDYALPNDCSFNKEIALIDLEQGIVLNKVAEPSFTLAIKGDYFAIGEPMVYIAKSKDRITDANNYNYISIYPFLCSVDRYLQLWYYRKPFGNFDDYYVEVSGEQYLLLEIPEEFYHLLYWATMENCYYKLGDARMGYAIQKKVEIFRDLKARNDGDRAMQRIVKEYPPSTIDEGYYEDGAIRVKISN